MNSITSGIRLCVTAISSSVLISACSQNSNETLSSVVDIQKPFGQSWDQIETPTENLDNECEEYLSELTYLFDSDSLEQVRENCTSEQYAEVFLEPADILPILRKGSVSVVYKAGIEPVMYSYSYLHEIHLTEDTRRRKREHAAELKKAMISKYSPPTLSGQYNQGDPFGFVPNNKTEQPCDFWAINNVGVLLCSERVILVDGYEMSMSFVRLDNSPHGKEMHRMILSYQEKSERRRLSSTEAGDIENYSPTTVALYNLTEWLGEKDLTECKRSNLLPIESAWTTPPIQNKELEIAYDKFNGDTLAEYAIELASENVAEESVENRNRKVMAVFKRAAEQGSPIAMNEIGASLLYCYQDVQQDIEAGIIWVERAVEAGDAFAMRHLAQLHLRGLTKSSNKLEDAQKLLERCSALDSELCVDKRDDLVAISNLVKK